MSFLFFSFVPVLCLRSARVILSGVEQGETQTKDSKLASAQHDTGL